MNFLAHLYLAGKDEKMIVGNFIADAVKGSTFNGYPEGIVKGIRLHREIDHFTDHHPVFLASRARLSPRYRMYSGVIVDIFYDHFLAKHWDDYSPEPLEAVVSRTYFLLIRHFQWLPARSKRILPFMVTRNWLVNYRNLDSLQQVFHGMDRRTGNRSGMVNAIADLQQDYGKYEEEFRDFFPRITIHIHDFRRNLEAATPSIQ